jgi:hypothetical protein
MCVDAFILQEVKEFEEFKDFKEFKDWLNGFAFGAGGDCAG